MNPSTLEKYLDEEVAKLKEMAIRSTDPLITAKATAVSENVVRELILKFLNDGTSLDEVIAFQSSQHSDKIPDVLVYFRFTPAESRIRLVDRGFAAVIEAVQGKFVGIINPFELQPEQRASRPFVFANTPNFGHLLPRRPEDLQLQERERAFFHSMGIHFVSPDRAGAAPATYVDCIGGTTTSTGDTESDGPYCDYHDDRLAAPTSIPV